MKSEMRFDEFKYYDDIKSIVVKMCNENCGYSLAKCVDQIIALVHSNTDKDDNLFEQVLCDSILPTWIQRFEAGRQIHDERGHQISLREHCYFLSNVVSDIQYYGGISDNTVERDGEILSWLSVSEWLDIAAGVDRVKVITGYYDESLMFCGSARRYEDHRSDLLSHLTTQLAVFSFVWGSLETSIKIIDPPKVPKQIKSGNSIIDRAIFYLKNEYEPSRTITFYDDTVAELRDTLKELQYYGNLTEHFRLEPHMGISGVGINIVRKIRNRFAHGTLGMPTPKEDDGLRPPDARLIEIITRVILLTIQMLLLAYLKDDYFEVDRYNYDECGEPISENIHSVLKNLHFKSPEADENQLPLFELKM